MKYFMSFFKIHHEFYTMEHLNLDDKFSLKIFIPYLDFISIIVEM